MSSDLFTAPASKARAVTLSDSAVVDARAFYVGGSGDLRCQLLDDADGTTTDFIGLIGGSIMSVSVKRFYETGSTASATLNIVALF